MGISVAMNLACNIDARGKAVRLGVGIGWLVAAVVLAFAWAVPAKSEAAWWVTAGLVVLGAFSIFEARAGWCVVRAMGFRTRL